MKMRWSTCWLPDGDKHDGSGWLAVDLQCGPDPESRSRKTMMLLASKTKAFKKRPSQIFEKKFFDNGQRKIVQELLEALNGAANFWVSEA